MTENIGTATTTVDAVPGTGFAELAEIKTFEPNPRIEALSKALESVRTFDTPPAPEHIVARAEVFLAFLSAED